MKKLVLSLTALAVLSISSQASDKICPIGFAVPTEAQLDDLDFKNAQDAFNKLKLTLSGYRNRSDAALHAVGSYGYYWTSSVSDSNARSLYFNASSATFYSYNRAYGFAVRCRKM